MKKRLLSGLLVIVMLAAMLPTFAVSAKETASYTLSLEKGNVSTNGSALVGYGTDGTQVEIPFAECTKGTVTVTGTVNTSAGESNRIDVTIPSGYNVAITLKDVSRTSTAASASDGIVVRGSSGGTLTMYVDGENKFYDTATYSSIIGGGVKVVVEGLNGTATDKLVLQHGLANVIGTTGNYEFKNVSLEFPELGISEIRCASFSPSGALILDTTAQIVDKTGTVYAGTGSNISGGYEVPEVAVKASASGQDSTWVLPQSVNGATYMFLPSDTDYAAMYFPAGLTLEGNNGKTVTTTAQATDVTALFTAAMEPGVTYDLKINGETVKIIKSANIGAMHIDLDADNLNYVHANKENQVTGKMVFVDEDGNVTIDTVPKFKGRGNHTWTAYAKKPYNFNTASKHTLTGGTKTKKYSLLANADDGSLIRNKVGMDLADKVGVGLGGQVPVDLWIDGEYRGNYLLTIKNDSVAPNPGYQIEIDNNAEPPVESGGDPQFLLNNWVESGYVNRFTVKAIDGYEVADALTKLQVIWDAIRDTESDDYMQYIDMESWANFYLLQEFVRDGDPVSGSKLMRYFGEEDKLYGGPVWDLGYSMGRTFDNGRSGGLDILSAEGWWVENIRTSASYWLQALGKHESFMEEVYRQYNLNKEAFDAVDEQVAELGQAMAASAAMNFTRWDLSISNLEYLSSNRTVGSGEYVQTYIKTNTWADFVTNLGTYAETRARFMANNILNGSVTLTLDGNTLTAAADCNGAALSYAWYDGETRIESASGATLDAAAYAGKTITVQVSDSTLRGTLVSNTVTVNEDTTDRDAAAAVDALIDAIGEVTVNSKNAIDAARAAYNALTNDQKALVTKLDTLTAAEAAYDAAVKAAADQAAAEAVDTLIDAIGEVTVNSKNAIDAARAAYNALTNDQTALVKKLSVLEAAEEAYAELTTPDVTDVTVRLSGTASTYLYAKEVTYTVSVEDTVNFATATVTFEVDAAYFSQPVVKGLNGFQVLATETNEEDGKLYISAIVFTLKGLTSEEAVEIASLVLVPAGGVGETTVTLTDAVLSIFDGTESEAFVNSVLADTTVTTKIVYSRYDVNKDGVVNQLDMTRSQRFYGTYNADADVNDDGIVDIADLILILNNFTV